MPRTLAGAADLSKIYFRESRTITAAEIYTQAGGTAGSNENISLYIRLNNTTDTLVQTVGAAAAERIFTNTGLSIAVVSGDYIEMKFVFPTWATPPTNFVTGGYLVLS
jgi:hypothetical protein